MIKFKYIEFKNFLSYSNSMTRINFDEDLNLFVGANGSGKSVFIDVLNYNLFGKPYRKVKLSTLINDKNNKGLYTKLLFEKNGVEWIIERGMSPKVFKVIKNNKPTHQENTKDYQNWLEENVLGFDEKVFRQIITMGSGYHVPFLKLELSKKRELIEQLFDLSVLQKMKDVSKKKVKLATERIGEIKEKKTKQEYEIDSVKKDLGWAKRANEERSDLIKKEKEEIKQEHNDIKKDIEYLTKELEKNEKNEKEINHKRYNELKMSVNSYAEKNVKFVNDMEQEKNDYKNKTKERCAKIIAKLEIGIRETSKKIDDLYTINNKAIEKITDDYNNEIKIKEKNILKRENEQDKLWDKETQIKFVRSNESCYTCGTILTPKKREEIIKEAHDGDIEKDIQKLEGVIETLKNNIKKLIKKKEAEILSQKNKYHEDEREPRERKEKIEIEINDTICKMDAEIDEAIKDIMEKFNMDMEKFGDKYREIEEEKKEIEKKIDLKNSLIEKRHNRTIEKNKLKDKYSKIHKKYETHNIEEYGHKLASKRKKLKEINSILEKKEKKIKYLNCVLLMLSDKDGIKPIILNNYLPVLNKKANEYISLFGLNLTIKITNEFDVILEKRIGKEIEYDQCSGGEKQRIDLALLFTFMSFVKMKSSINTNLIVFDEILDNSLDEEGIDILIDILRLFSNNNYSICVISHRESNFNRFENIYHVKIEGGFSHIERESKK